MNDECKYYCETVYNNSAQRKEVIFVIEILEVVVEVSEDVAMECGNGCSPS